MKEYLVKSNREAGKGRSDIYIKCVTSKDLAIIIEIKLAKKHKELEITADKALDQIEEKKYAYDLEEEGYRKILKYGISFFTKDCLVKIADY